MLASLLDVNVWLAAAFEAHPGHRSAQAMLLGIQERWWHLAGLAEAGPKRWMDPYLAAFAVTGSIRLATFDQDFRQFLTAELDLELLPVRA